MLSMPEQVLSALFEPGPPCADGFAAAVDDAHRMEFGGLQHVGHRPTDAGGIDLSCVLLSSSGAAISQLRMRTIWG